MDLMKSHYRQYRINVVENPMVVLPEASRRTLGGGARYPFTPQLMELYGILRSEFQDRWVDHLDFRTILLGKSLPPRRKRKPEGELTIYGPFRYWGRNMFESTMGNLAMLKRSEVISTRSGVWFAAKEMIPDLSPNELIIPRISRKIVDSLQSAHGVKVTRYPLLGDPRYASMVVEDLQGFIDQWLSHNDKAKSDAAYLLAADLSMEGNATREQLAELLNVDLPVFWPAFSMYKSSGKLVRIGARRGDEFEE